MKNSARILIAVLLFYPLAGLAGPVGEKDIQEINDRFDLAYELYAKKKNDESSKTAINAYSLAAKRLGSDYRLSDYAYHVAALHQNMGKYDLAEKYHRRNLEIKKNFLQFPDGQLVIAYNNVASVLNLKQKYREALKLLLNIDAEKNRSYERELSFFYSNTARAHFGLNDVKKAEEYISLSIPIIEKYYGRQSVNYADANLFLARIELTKGQKPSAIRRAQQSRRILSELDFTNNPLFNDIEAFLAKNRP